VIFGGRKKEPMVIGAEWVPGRGGKPSRKKRHHSKRGKERVATFEPEDKRGETKPFLKGKWPHTIGKEKGSVPKTGEKKKKKVVYF